MNLSEPSADLLLIKKSGKLHLALFNYVNPASFRRNLWFKHFPVLRLHLPIQQSEFLVQVVVEQVGPSTGG